MIVSNELRQLQPMNNYMKKNQQKGQEKTNFQMYAQPKRPSQAYKYINSTQPYSYNSAKNLRPILPRTSQDSPSKYDGSNRNSRRPEFIKHLNKANQQRRKEFQAHQGINKDDFYEQHQKDSPQKLKIAKNKDLRETMKSDPSQYQKLHDKLNYLQTKINELSNNIDKKKEQKWVFLQNEKKERIRRFQQAKLNEQPAQSKINDSLKKFVTQVNEGKDYIPPSFNPYSPRNNIYYVSEILKFHKQERSLAREHIAMSAQYIRAFESRRVPTQQQAERRMIKLNRKPGTNDKKSVVFDLDETLIHCNDSVEIPNDVKITIKFPTGQQIEAGINIRPHAVELLRALSKNFQIIVFTASHSCYANVVLDYLDPNNEFIHHRLYREHCFVTSDGVYVKDLRVLNRDLSQVVLVDNAAYSYAFQLDNAIPILPYYKGKNDFELKALQTYIEGMIFQKDVRQLNRKTFKLHRYREFDDIDQLVKTLYGQFL